MKLKNSRMSACIALFDLLLVLKNLLNIKIELLVIDLNIGLSLLYFFNFHIAFQYLFIQFIFDYIIFIRFNGGMWFL